MFNVCPKCGEYRVDKLILPEENAAVCPVCEFKQKFVRLPLFVLTGASGVGKTATCLELSGKAKDVVVMESDVLWRDEFNQPENDYQNYREMWLRVCKNISQAGKPVVLCGAGVPAQFESCAESRYFSDIYYLALVCDDEILAAHLKSRPVWRGSGADEYIKEHIAFNNWLKENAQKTNPPMSLLETSRSSIKENAGAVEKWIKERIS